MINHLPHPIASIVLLEGTKYLIDEIGFRGWDYSLLGHESIGSKGFGIAWINHDELSFVQEPSLETWKMLLQAREEDDD